MINGMKRTRKRREWPRDDAAGPFWPPAASYKSHKIGSEDPAMEIKLHANATTTPRIRRYLQQSDKSDRELATELGISVTTVRRWRNREQVSDNHTTPKVIHKALRQEQVALVNALRDITGAPLDELLQMVNSGLGIAGVPRDPEPLPQTGFDKAEGHDVAGKKGAEGRYRAAKTPFTLSASLLTRWANDALEACPAVIQSVETFGFEVKLEKRNTTVTVHPQQYRAVQVDLPLCEIIPRLNSEPAGELLIQLCEIYNRGKAQKKLGESTPQAFLEALRHKD
ncbi:hypothetical protein L1887_46526 [Cichorium endivia]|nr:hypothetical protein L1887_46526 [Cichorium endivia]